MGLAERPIIFGSGSLASLAPGASLEIGTGITSSSGQSLTLDSATGTITVAASDNIVATGTSQLNFSAATGQVSFGGNVDATLGLDVTGAAFTIGASSSFSQTVGSFSFTGTSFTLSPTGAISVTSAAAQTQTFTIADATASAYLLREGSNAYFTVTTTNSAEAVTFGNATTNPSYSFAGSGTVAMAGSATIAGNLTVTGTTFTTNSETVLINDNHLYLNNAYNTVAAQSLGLVGNYLPTSTNDTTAGAGVITAGVASTSNPTITTAGTATFTVGDIIQISGATNPANNGLFEVLSHSGTTLTIRGIGVTATVEDFTQNQLVSTTDTGLLIRKINVSIFRAGTDGIWESGKGATTPITFADVATGVDTLDASYTAGRTITQDLGPIIVNGDGATTGGTLDINPNVLAETSAQIDVTFAAGAYTGTPKIINADYSTMTSLTNAADVVAIMLTGKTNAGAGNSVGISVSAFDVGISNASSLTQSGAATFSGGVTSSAGEVLISGGNFQLNDAIVASFGTDDDGRISYSTAGNGTLNFGTFSASGVNGPTVAISGATPAGGTASGGNVSISAGVGTGGGANGNVVINANGSVNITADQGGVLIHKNLNIQAAASFDMNGTTVNLNPTQNYVLNMAATKTAITTVSDNLTNAFQIKEGSNNYCAVNTNNGTENISLGNATTNPTYSFLGNGTATFSGLISAGLGITIASAQVLTGATLLALKDSFQTGSTYSTPISLSSSSAEWSLFETNFGEVSLLNAISQAATAGFSGIADVTITAKHLLSADDAGGNGNISTTVYTAAGARAHAIGVAAAGAAAAGTLRVLTSGEATIPDALWDTAPVATDIGSFAYGSVATSGEYTLVAPSTSGQVSQQVGVVTFASGTANTARISIQIHSPITIG